MFNFFGIHDLIIVSNHRRVSGMGRFFWVLRNTSASLANTFAYSSPVVTVILGWVILSEPITEQIVFATLILMIGVVLIVNRDKYCYS
jgi:drug/metabolite transporter (DMT)-like permease